MKIAVMTQPIGHNYGGVMQAFALQAVIKDIGFEVETIDRQKDKKSLPSRMAKFIKFKFNKLIGREKSITEENPRLYLRNAHSFIEENIRISHPIFDSRSLESYIKGEGFTAVVVGSDQTWRPRYSPCIGNFFLDFLSDYEIKRVAYASSFGVDNWEFSAKQTVEYSDLLKKFDAVSVREVSGVDLCCEYFGVDAAFVLDPTLLLHRDRYVDMIGSDRLQSSSCGVYTYFLDKTPEKTQFAHLLRDHIGEELYTCMKKYGVGRVISSEENEMVMPSPKDWLAGFANASFVITDSFHGVVFSIIMKKPFFAIGNTKRGLSRFVSLLGALGLMDRLIVDVDVLDLSRSDLLEIDWDRVECKISDLRKHSIQYLQESLVF